MLFVNPSVRLSVHVSICCVSLSEGDGDGEGVDAACRAISLAYVPQHVAWACVNGEGVGVTTLKLISLVKFTYT